MKIVVNNPTLASDVELEVFGLGVFKNDGKENIVSDEAQLDIYRAIYRQDPPASITVGSDAVVPEPVIVNEEEDI